MKFGTFIPPSIVHKTSSLAPDAPNEQFSLESLQGLVGGYVQALPFGRYPNDKLLIINEDGKSLGLPVNPRATELAQKECGIALGDFIVGNAIVIHADQFE